MSSNRVLIKNYTEITGKRLPTYPLVEVKIWIDNEEKNVDALVDTGYDGNLLLSKEKADELNITDDYLIQDDPDNIQVANGEEIETYLYQSTVRLGNIQGPLSFNVVSTKNTLIWDAILGRSALYSYEVLFNEKIHPKKLIITK